MFAKFMGIIPRGCSYLICLIVALLGSPLFAGETLEVTTADGRVLSGEVDRQSNKQTLWLRLSQDNIILTTAVPWTDVVSATLDGQAIPVAEIVDDLAKYATSAPQAFLTQYEPIQIETQTVSRQIKPKIATIQVEAGLANLDRTVELVGFAAFDTNGNVTPYRGTLNARLIVQRTNFHTGRISFDEFQRWSIRVGEKNFYDQIAQLSLPFHRPSPDFDWELCPSAILNVRLGVPGQGNYEASVPVTIREINPLRDTMQNWIGTRFYRDELTHNTRHDSTQLLHMGYSPSP
jgi:hypothetical protein